jgi:SAM-dependent methyltransferase
MKNSSKLNVLDYQYPKFLLYFPNLVRIIYVLNYFTQLRKWYVMSAWQRLLKQAKPNAVIIDFGAGEAQYLVPFCRMYPQKTFCALDMRQSNIQFCESFALPNLQTSLVNIEEASAPLAADLGLCVGVMQYLTQDTAALKNMHESLKSGATLLLYVPINGVFITPFYKYIFARMAQYESINNRQRVYTEKELTEKLVQAGFVIQNKTYTYGYFGKLSHEILNSLSTLIFSGGLLLKMLALLLFPMAFPLIFLFMLLDYNNKKSDGNGLLLEVLRV